MTRLIVTFAVGFALGGLTLVVLRHELSLGSHVGTVSLLAGVGALLVTVLAVWAARIKKLVAAGKNVAAEGEPAPWSLFLWASAVLLAIYLTLATIVLFA